MEAQMKSLATAFGLAAMMASLAIAPFSEAGAGEHSSAVIAAPSRSGPPFDPTLDDIQANVFNPSCAASFCHGAAMQANLDLREGASYAALVDVASVEVPSLDRVEPFDPDASYLICKLEDCPVMVGQQMPLIGGPLDQEVIDVIRQWILLGAPEDGSIAVDEESWGRIKAAYR
jgi:hypothetical protein